LGRIKFILGVMTVRSMVEQCMHTDGRMTLIGSVLNSTCYDTEAEDTETRLVINQ